MLGSDIVGDSFFLSGSGVANSSLDGFLQSFFVTAGDVHFCSVALEGLGDDEAEARAAL